MTLDCNVRNWKWGNKKYIRFTVVAKSTTYCGTTGMLWKGNKYELFDVIECEEETIYGIVNKK